MKRLLFGGTLMKENRQLQVALGKIRDELRNFIEVSLRKNEPAWVDWVSNFSRKIEPNCWERKNCSDTSCPAYKNTCGRCWIIAGSMQPGEVYCKFAERYQSCKKCEVYQEAVYQDQLTEVEEYLIVLIHSLRSKQQDLNEQANTDLLTALPNRRFIESYIAHEHKKMARHNTSAVLVMADINGLKGINDRHGHITGDKVIMECAAILREATRESDVVSRFGGDEFLFLLHEDQKHDEAVGALIARIEECLAKRNGAREEGGPVISLSFGHAILRKRSNIAKTIARADKHMYLDKARRKKLP
jgi:diguanylate cyclase (GGDEF)-like protein